MTDNKDLQSLFGLGDKNDAFAKYFIGQSYLKHLVDPHDNIDFGVGVVTFELDVVIIGTFIVRVTKFCW